MIDVEELGEKGKQIYETFRNYIDCLEKVVKVQLPDILPRAEALVNEVGDVQANAKDQFASLDFKQQIQAAKALTKDVRSTTALPGIIKQSLEDLKDDLMQIKDAVNQLKTNMLKIQS